jgi:hypothetical protein
MTLKSRLVRPFARRTLTPALAQIDSRLESLAARLETHTVNLAEYQAQLRDETMRQIVNEIRSNSAFLAHSVVALERVESRRKDLVHAAVRPLVHEVGLSLPDEAGVIIADHVDPILVDELVAEGHRITIVNPAIDHAMPPEVVVNMATIEKFRGPVTPADLVVWVARSTPAVDALRAVRGWLATGGQCVLACPARLAPIEGFTVEQVRAYTAAPDGRYRRRRTSAESAPASEGIDLFVHQLRAR